MLILNNSSYSVIFLSTVSNIKIRSFDAKIGEYISRENAERKRSNGSNEKYCFKENV